MSFFLSQLSESTSSEYYVQKNPLLSILSLGTTSKRKNVQKNSIRATDSTASHLKWKLPKSRIKPNIKAIQKAIFELRRLSGLTWKQLGQLFEVPRCSIHFWDSGKAMYSVNEKRLIQVLNVIRYIDRGSARSTHTALFEANEDMTPFDMLVKQRFHEVCTILGQGKPRPIFILTELSDEAKAARKPLSPIELLGTKSDRIHYESSRARAARTVRSKRRGNS